MSPTAQRDERWFVLRVPVRFRDLDSMGHAHHTLPLIYLEEARAALWREVKGSAALDAIDYVMAEVTVRFHARILYPGEVDVALSVRSIGNSSFTTDFEIAGADGALLASGSAVQVAYDYEAGRTRRLNDEERRALSQWLAEADAASDVGPQEKRSAMPAEMRPMKPPST